MSHDFATDAPSGKVGRICDTLRTDGALEWGEH